MKRIFIAVKIDAGAGLLDMISDMKQTLRDEKIKWTETENFHITIAFLGETVDDKVKAVSRMLKDVSEGSGAFEMLIKGAGVFKSFNDPRVLWTTIEPSEKLTGLYGAVMPGLRNIGIELEERAFRPHLTLGRIKRINDIDRFKILIMKYMNTELQRQHVNEVILYESVLFQSGPVYKPLAKYSLK
jgi:RNA 2',3'-cyclic 3'-phosphodiesterase